LADKEKNILLDDSYLTSKIEDFEQKTLEQKKIQERLQTTTDNEPAGVGGDVIGVIPDEELKTRFGTLKDDIKIIEMYKKNLENEISEYRNDLKNSLELKKTVYSLKLELISLRKEQDILKIENRKLFELMSKYSQIKDSLKNEISEIINKHDEYNNALHDLVKSNEILKNENNFLEKTKEILMRESEEIKKEINSIKDELEILKNERNS
jgi:chromosome segregation ATPase